jgi:hypothetical protein
MAVKMCPSLVECDGPVSRVPEPCFRSSPAFEAKKSTRLRVVKLPYFGPTAAPPLQRIVVATYPVAVSRCQRPKFNFFRAMDHFGGYNLQQVPATFCSHQGTLGGRRRRKAGITGEPRPSQSNARSAQPTAVCAVALHASDKACCSSPSSGCLRYPPRRLRRRTSARRPAARARSGARACTKV